MTDTILITGSNRGIGLELVKQYAGSGWHVHACCRQPDSAVALQALRQAFPSITIHALDVTDNLQIKTLAKQLRSVPVDILLNNAGIYGQGNGSFGEIDEADWMHCFRINTIAPMMMMEAFVSHVAASEHKLIASMSSKMGSMADNSSGGSYVYRSSKAALNAVMKSAAIDLRSKGIKVAILHPGWVLTDMGGPNAEITVDECVMNLRKNLENVTINNSGTFFEIDGSVIPW